MEHEPIEGLYNMKQSAHPLPHVKFMGNKNFVNELQHRVNKYFESSGLTHFATSGVYIKGLLILAIFFTTYVFLVFIADELWQGVVGAVILGFALVGIGVNLQHDGSHNAFSNHRWINRAIAMTADLIGASSYFWRWKHNRIHHMFTNVYQYDTDIDFGILGRVAPTAQRRWFHRWQHVYIWLFYGLMVIKWQLFDDFYSLVRGRLGNHPVPRPAGTQLLVFLFGKCLFFSYAFVLPFIFHPVMHVLFFYTVVTVIAGLTLSMIFVLPHCSKDSEFPLPDKKTGNIATSRAIHQVHVTLDFARKNLIATWLVGGLNYHREHHLFPGMCHVHYHKIAKIIDNVCDEFDIPHKEHKSYIAGLVSHYHWLRRMGNK
jgi:linoleoyl-CoA desaturase